MNVTIVAECARKARPKTVSAFEGAAMERLARLAGAGDPTLVASVFELRTLFDADPGVWSPGAARASALDQLAELDRADVLVLLGRRVWLAFGGRVRNTPWFTDWSPEWRRRRGVTFAAPLLSRRGRLRSSAGALDFEARELGFWRALFDVATAKTRKAA